MRSPSTKVVGIVTLWSFITESTTALNLTIITFDKNDLSYGVQEPTKLGYDVIFGDLHLRYPGLLQHGSLTHIPLYYVYSDMLIERNEQTDTEAASEADVFFQFYYANQELFAPAYNEGFTALVIDSKQMGGLGVFKDFIREVPIFLAVIDPEEDIHDIIHRQNYYPTVVNLIPSQDSYYYTALKVLAVRFSWTKMVAVCECAENECPDRSFDGYCLTIIDVMTSSQMDEVQYDIKRFTLRSDNSSACKFDEALDVAVQKSFRVVVLLLSQELIRLIMVRAYHKNMTQHGDYVFITIQLPSNDPSNLILQWSANDSDDSVAALAFNSLLLFTKRRANPNEMKNFTDKVAKIAAETNLCPPPSSYFTMFQTIELLDMIPIIFQAINRVSDELHLLSPGTFLYKMFNQTYDTFAGPTYMDSKGSLVSPISVLRFNRTSKMMENVFDIQPITGEIIKKAGNSFHWFGRREFPPDILPCGVHYEKCISSLMDQRLTSGISSSLCILTIIVFLVLWWVRTRSIQKQYNHVFLDSWTSVTLHSSAIKNQSKESIGTRGLLGTTDIYAVKVTTTMDLRQAKKNQKLCRKMLLLHDLKHSNVSIFYGVSFQDFMFLLCGEFSERGDLHSVTTHNSLLTGLKFRLSFMADITEAVVYIHNSSIKFHGGLTSHACIVTSRFSVKVAQTGYNELSHLLSSGPAKIPLKATMSSFDRNSQTEDVYCTGVIWEELVSGLKSPVPSELQKAINSCLTAKSTERPRAAALLKTIRRYAKTNSSVAALLMSQLEQHAESLETSVKKRTVVLEAEMAKVDSLLQQILPPAVIVQLRNRETVKAELFESATVLFSDIPIFATIVYHYMPWVVVEFLNAIYSVFDKAVAAYDVYKVETINDSYVVTSGIPIRNGIKHASEICSLSILLRAAAKTLELPTKDKLTIKVRIGINSGTVAAGIVGKRMPRYCLFGDAMNTASRMESHGKEDFIHVGGATEKLAGNSNHRKFKFESRGLVDIKGKGLTETYWLLEHVTKPEYKDDNV